MEQIGDAEWLRGRKKLIDPELLNPIQAVITRARKDIKRLALPFPVEGLTLVPKDIIQDLEGTLEQRKAEYWAAVELFLEDYERAREMAREALGDLFSEADYPVDMRRKFGFDWRYFAIDTPGKYEILSPQVYEREKAKFHEMIERVRVDCIRALRAEFGGFVGRLVERLTPGEDGTAKTFKGTTVSKLTEFLDMFDARNLFEDDDLAAMVEKAKAMMRGVSAEALRDSAGLQQTIRSGMGAVLETVEKDLINMPIRKIRRDKKAA